MVKNPSASWSCLSTVLSKIAFVAHLLFPRLHFDEVLPHLCARARTGSYIDIWISMCVWVCDVFNILVWYQSKTTFLVRIPLKSTNVNVWHCCWDSFTSWNILIDLCRFEIVVVLYRIEICYCVVLRVYQAHHYIYSYVNLHKYKKIYFFYKWEHRNAHSINTYKYYW